MTMKGRAKEKRVTVSRRGFLKTVGAIGGAAALEGV
jgi:hypothetical protein